MRNVMLPPSPVISLLGYECYLKFDRYSSNDTICITAINADQTDLEYGEELFVSTVNWEQNWESQFQSYKKLFQFPAVVIKDYSENEGMFKALANAGVIKMGGAYLSGSGGTVHGCCLTEEWQEIAKKQLSI